MRARVHHTSYVEPCPKMSFRPAFPVAYFPGMVVLTQTRVRTRRVSRLRTSCLVALVCALGGWAPAEQSSSGEARSPRQAALEMLAGDETDFKKHLTQEMQAKIEELAKN